MKTDTYTDLTSKKYYFSQATKSDVYIKEKEEGAQND